jgi:uncharacterized membrane protein YbhN (UPF0104 family)
MSSKTETLKHLKQILPSLLTLLIFCLCLWAIYQELHKYKLAAIFNSITAIPPEQIAIAIALTCLNYVMFTGYDTLATIYIRHPLPYAKTSLAAVTSYAISNSVGLALLSGSAIRYRLYSAWGLSTIEITNIIAFCNLSFWLGLFAVGGVTFILAPVEVPTILHLPFNTVHPLGVIFLLIIVAYLLLTIVTRNPFKIGSWIIPQLPLKLALIQIAVTSLDWGLAAAIFYVLLPEGSSLSYPGFFGIYLLAQIAGILSNVPGGLGVFETIMLLLLSPTIPSVKLLGTLLAYRGIYYFLPLIIAAFLLGLYEIYRRKAIGNKR